MGKGEIAEGHRGEVDKEGNWGKGTEGEIDEGRSLRRRRRSRKKGGKKENE